MRTSLLELEQMDRYLLQQLDASEQMLFEAKLILDPELHGNLRVHRKVHALIRWFARSQQKERLQRLHEQLMHDTKFRDQVNAFFI